jgi:hypothetical protein
MQTKEQKAAQLVRQGADISVVHDSEFRKLLEHGRPARIADRIAGEPVEWLRQPTTRVFKRVASIKGPLDQEHSVFGRAEQSYLRHILFGGAEHAVCSLCGRRLPVGLLIAAHIKPRSECSRRERLDAENIVFGVCLLGCDALYERGFLAVGKNGQVLISPVQCGGAMKSVFRRFLGRTCKGWRAKTAEYFKWHLTQRFQGSNG